jgi:serine/threonine protein kinase
MTMSADTKNAPKSFLDQLASLDDKLHTTSNDVAMLADIHKGIGSLLASSGNNDAEIRRLLQACYDEGGLRKETYQLVMSVLDRYATEILPTSPNPENQPILPTPLPIDPEPMNDDQFGATTVIPSGFAPDPPGESRVQVGSLLRDRYLLQEKVSGGSMGVVYKAMDRRLAEAGSENHWVAVKVLAPKLAANGQALRALQQEAAKGRCLVHPHIVQFVDLDRDDDLYFLIMEWLDGRNLADILDSKDASVIDNKAAFRITRQIGEALDYAHSRGIVHADIKPGNIMIMPNGDAKLFDFGVARVRQQHSGREFDPGVLGAMTPAYSSMQVLTGEEPVATDDVFSLSCLLYRLLAGYRVFGPRDAAEASQAGMKPQRLKSLNDSQWRALKKGLSYSRVTRFGSVREFIDALEENPDEPFRVEEPERFVEADDHSAVGKWIVAFLLIVGLTSIAAYQFGYLEPLIDRFTERTVIAPRIIENDTPTIEAPEIVLPAAAEEKPFNSEPDPEPAITVAEPLPAENEVVELPVVVEETAVVEPITDAPLAGPDPMLVDFSALPPPTEVIPFSPNGRNPTPVNIAVREDGPVFIIDFVRGSNLSVPLTLRLEEVGFSGNRSPWAAGQYALSNSGLVQFSAGQARGRVSLTMASDPLREADQQSTLRLRDAEYADSELAIVNVTLEDDDQRAFEARLPANTVAFAVSQASVREMDPAVQIDLVRFNPDNSQVVVGFTVSDLSADEGRDYFGPGDHTISFGPGQRSARLLVPLVQDSEVEGDEQFIIELNSGEDSRAIDVYHRIVVTIRDDDLQTP